MKRLIAGVVVATVALAVLITRAHPSAPADPSGCELPPRDCDEDCDDLVELSPPRGPGYEDVRLAEETTPATSTSYLRRDLMMLVKYAAARVACVAATWPTGNGGPIALSDASDRTGATPGTLTGLRRHPRSTHVAGRDLDVGYFQRGTADNHLRPICAHRVRGVEQRRCVGPPTKLDAKRTALLIGTLYESPGVRIVGVDARAAGPIEDSLHELCRDGLVTPVACLRVRLGYEPVDTGRGWFAGHENHLHISWYAD